MNWTEIIVAGVMGYTWSQILTRDGMAFGWLPQYINPNWWVAKPLYLCPACVAGYWYLVWWLWTGPAWAMIPHLFAAIFIADVLAKKL